MRVIWTRDGGDDFQRILSYIRERSPQGARNVSRRIREVTRLIARFPLVGEATRHPRFRKTTASPYPYLVFYEVRADAIYIIAIRHTARDPASMPDAD